MFVFSLYIFYVHDTTPHACQAYLQIFRARAREYLAQGLCVKWSSYAFTYSFVLLLFVIWRRYR